MKLNKKMESMLKAKGFIREEDKIIKPVKSTDGNILLGHIVFELWSNENDICNVGMWKQIDGFVISLPTLDRIANQIRNIESELDRLWME